jgi:Protein of unknown function (DUF642)/PEP-CTERM motif
MKRIIMAVMLTTMVCLAPGVSQAATIIFSDDFNGENLELNHPGIPTPFPAGFANWTVTDGTVDVIGEGGPFDFFSPGNGHYIDLDGTSNDAGIMQAAMPTLYGGVTYDLTFDLAGSQRGDDNALTPLLYGINLDGLGGLEHFGSQTLNSGIGFTTFTLSFTPLVDTSVAFIQFGQNQVGGDNVGLLLDNVKVSTEANLPEPASLMLLGAGLAGIGIWRRKAKV